MVGDPRRYDLALLFSLSAVPIAGCAVGLDDKGPGTSWTSVGSGTQTDGGGGEEETGGGDDDTGGSSITTQGPADGSGDPTSAGTTVTTDPTGASMTDPTNASVTNPTMDPTYGGSYGSSYGGSYGSYGGSYGSGGGMIPEVCYQFAQHYADCQPMAQYGEILDYCAGDLAYGMMLGMQCSSALEEFYACMSSADCNEITMGDPCNGQGLSQVCGGP